MNRKEDLQDLLSFVQRYKKKMQTSLKNQMLDLEKYKNRLSREQIIYSINLIKSTEKCISDYANCETRISNQLELLQ